MDVPPDLRTHLVALRSKRANRKLQAGRRPRTALSATARAQVLAKTGGRCHICGGSVEGAPWAADHVLAHSAGGGVTADNFLPAHSTCNSYRWDFESEEFQYILKLGVWARTQIERATTLGDKIAKDFTKYEKHRVSRRRQVAPNKSLERVRNG